MHFKATGWIRLDPWLVLKCWIWYTIDTAWILLGRERSAFSWLEDVVDIEFETVQLARRQLRLNFQGFSVYITQCKAQAPLRSSPYPRSSGVNRHTWGDQDTAHAALMLDVDRRSKRSDRDWILYSVPNAQNLRFWLYLAPFGRDAYFCGVGCKQRKTGRTTHRSTAMV